MELRRRSKLADGFAAIGANALVLVIIFAVNGLLVLIAYLLRSERPPPPTVDVVFVFDTTGSMRDEIDGMVRASRDFAAELASTGADFRIGAVTFGDEVRATQPMTNDVEQVRGFFGRLSAEGGDDEPEDFILGGMTAASSMTWRPEAKRFFIFITDASYHPRSAMGQSFDDLRQAAKTLGATVYVAAVPAVREYRTFAEETGGKFYDIHGMSRFDMVVIDIGKNIAGSLSQ